MSTAKELDLKPGDIAMWISARKPSETGIGLIVGIPLDDLNAEVHLEAGEVVETNIPCGAVPGTRFRLLYSDDPWNQKYIGDTITIHNGFRNYVDEADARMLTQLRNTGLSVQTIIDPQGKRSFELVPTSQELPKPE